ncbi:MAG: putative signal transducing protein [Myxococcota bacterium]
MKFCPECRMAYKDEIESCPDCNVPLVSGLEEFENIEFVELVDVEGPFKANLITDVLKDNQIECYLYSEPVHIYPIPGEGIQYTIYVNRDKLEQARSLLEDIEKGEEMEPLPDDEST